MVAECQRLAHVYAQKIDYTTSTTSGWEQTVTQVTVAARLVWLL